MNKILVLIAYLFTLSIRAQQPFPTPADQPVWNVLECNLIDGLWCSTVPYQYIDSAEVCGHTYGFLTEPFYSSDTMYVRNVGQRTRFRMGAD